MEQREIDNMLLSMIQKHFPSLPLSDEYTDWGKWLGFARAVYESGRASPASVPEGFTMSEPTILPDGSGFGTMSFPLPKDHWIYKEREFDILPRLNAGDSHFNEASQCALTCTQDLQLLDGLTPPVRRPKHCARR